MVQYFDFLKLKKSRFIQNKQISLSVKVLGIAWFIYWVLLVIINIFYFKSDNYPKLLLFLWTILFTICGIGIFYGLSIIYDKLIATKTKSLKIVVVSILLSIGAAYIWSLFEPIISWIINPSISSLEIKWDIGNRGTFSQSFIMAFFSVSYYFSKKIEQLKVEKTIEDDASQKTSSQQETVAVYSKNEIFLLPISDIKKISVNGNYSTLIDHENSKFEIKKTLKKWESELPIGCFKRIHRSTIINTKFIEKIEPWHNYSYRIKLKGIDQPEDVSRRYAAQLKKEMKL